MIRGRHGRWRILSSAAGSIGAILLTGCPTKIDVAPNDPQSADGPQAAPAAQDADAKDAEQGAPVAPQEGQAGQAAGAVPSAARGSVRPDGPQAGAVRWASLRTAGQSPLIRGSLGDTGQREILLTGAETTGSAGDAASGATDDPVKANGPIFEGWPRPKVMLVFSGELNGYLEPCGCAGLENQKGGLKRRHTLLENLRKEGTPVVPLDLGGQVKRIGTQADIKFRHAVESLVKLDYRAVGFGPRDLKIDVLGAAVNLDEQSNPFVSANVALVDFDSGFTRRFRVIDAGQTKIGVTSILGTKLQQGLENLDFVQCVDPVAALDEVVKELQAARCDYTILLSHADPEESQALARRFPIFDFVVTAGGAQEPPRQAAEIEGTKAQLIEVGHKGMYVAAVGLYDDARKPFRLQRVPLDSRFPDSREMQQSMIEYQQELQTLGLAGLGLKGIPVGGGRKFVGTQKCAECHSEAMEVWENSPHAHATESIANAKYSNPPRLHDPECLSCHATGWDPQKYFPYSSGFKGLASTPHLAASGCENCHGPGSAHVAAETPAGTQQQKEQEREFLRLRLVDNEGNKEGQAFGKVAQTCVQCHDLDNSPEFDFQGYWPDVEHFGME